MVDHQIQDHLSKRNFTDAEPLIREKILRAPESADGHYLLGVLHYFQGQVGKSVQDLKAALKIDPHHTDAAICLSVLFNDVGKYEEAKKVFELANQSVVHQRSAVSLGIDRKFAVKHLEIADLYFRYRRYDNAIDEYTKAIQLDPPSYEIRIRRAKAYAKKGFLTRAVQELQQIKAEAPGYLTARIQLGLLHFSQGNVLDAELEWEGVQAADPRNREAASYLEMARRSRDS